MRGWTDRTAAAAFAVALTAGPAAALDVDGVYKLTAESDCARIGEDGGALRVEQGVLYGVESQCRMINEVPIRNMNGSLFDMMCTGEGTEWAERALVMRGAEGQLILVWNGYAFAYPRCEGVVLGLSRSPRPRPRP